MDTKRWLGGRHVTKGTHEQAAPRPSLQPRARAALASSASAGSGRDDAVASPWTAAVPAQGYRQRHNRYCSS
eukprot:scaffold60808_cov66-Phaeocystis_antarctica.AAC.13